MPYFIINSRHRLNQTLVSSALLAHFLFPLLFLFQPLSSIANLHKANLFRTQLLTENQPHDAPITSYFEVTKPITVPNTKPCSLLVLQHDFGYTYEKPPALANYKPPSNCPSQNFSKIILEWKATCKGTQFDRIFGVWLAGVEILRSCTAEPTDTGIVWTVEKDITKYSSLLKDPQLLTVYLGNLVDSTYTGVYHVNLTFHFYPAEEKGFGFKQNPAKSETGFSSPADLIIPISRNLPLNDGLWFPVQNSTDVQVKEFSIPRNAYRAVLEVYVSFHSSDEFWYGNPPNDYILANNLTGTAGNGPFREVVVSLDGKVVGAVWPFTVIYTGGVNPLLWTPITGIGSFDLPSYDIEITPFLGKILDGKSHKLGFGVRNALSIWYIDANLHVWLDSKITETKGQLIHYKNSPHTFSLISHFKGLNGTFLTNARRSMYSSGWVESSHGKITMHSFQGFTFINSMDVGKNGNLRIVNQTIDTNRIVDVTLQSSYSYIDQQIQRFSLYLYTENVDQGNSSYASRANLTLGFKEERFLDHPRLSLVSSLNNVQDGQSKKIVKGNLVTSGIGSTQEVCKYDGIEGCYFRNISSTNNIILYDKTGNLCSKNQKFVSGYRFGGWRNFF